VGASPTHLAISNPEEGQLELATTKQDQEYTYLYNPRTKKYDTIDLATGKDISVVEEILSPTSYSILIADIICDRIRAGETLQSICRDKEMPSISRFYHWLALQPGLRIRYEQARKQRADAFHDRALELALSMPSKDEVPGVKLAVDTLKWAAEKASPDYYGKQEKVAGGTSINVTLHTGVLDTQSPPDIVIDEYGNFKGFDNGTENRSEQTHEQEPTGTLAKAERWAVKDTEEE
jgi:hypothetical protein